MLRRTLTLFLLLLCSPFAPAAGRDVLGLNLAGIADWSTEVPFTDVSKMARPWISQARGKSWGLGGPLEVDERGWVKRLAEGQFAETVLFTDDGSQAPEGVYRCRYEGKGEVQFGGAGSIVGGGPGDHEVKVVRGRGALSLRLVKTDPTDPVRNLRLLRPGAEGGPFAADFLARCARFGVLRFMDWQSTNGSPLERWQDRPRPEDATFSTRKGVCVETMVDLANATGTDPWFCLPHRADDDFVRGFARLVKERLHPGRRVYVEYSNECWNGGFEQARYCRERGHRANLSTNAYEAQLRFYAERSCQIFALWEEVFGGRERLVRVLATQSANPWTGTTVLDWKEAHRKADAVAVAPYFGNEFGDPKRAEQTAAMGVEELLAGCRRSIAANRAKLKAYAELARWRGLKLLAYEGGQHLVGHGGAENHRGLEKLFHAANRHPGMKDLYREDLRQWYATGGGLFCVFSSVGRYSKWGGWGVLERADQDPATAPKYQALLEYLEKEGRK